MTEFILGAAVMLVGVVVGNNLKGTGPRGPIGYTGPAGEDGKSCEEVSDD